MARLWRLERVTLVSSEYTIEEARRNLDGEQRLARLQRLLGHVTVIEAQPDRPLPKG